MTVKELQAAALLRAHGGTDADRAWLLIGMAREALEDDSQRMLDMAVHAMQYAEASGDGAAMAHSQRYAGIARRRHGRSTEAAADLSAALTRFELLRDNEGIALAAGDLADVYSDTGLLDRALEFRLRSFRAWEATNDSLGKARSLIATGAVYLAKCDHPRAVECCEQGVAILRGLDNPQMLSRGLTEAGGIFARMGDRERAIACRTEVLALEEDATTAESAAIRLEAAAATEMLREDPAHAMATYDFAMQMRSQLGDRRGMAIELRNMALIHAQIGNHDGAVEVLRRALAIVENMDLPGLRLDVLTDCAREYELAGNATEALRHLKAAFAVRDSTALGAGRRNPTALELEFDRERDQSTRDSLRARRQSLEQLALRSQISPHFLFNALNSIQFFLTNNDRSSAHRYLSKLSRLLRLSLENARESLILLAVEVEAVELYVEMERLRVGDRVSCDIQVHSDIGADDVLIPPMILQPFVENAVWHGIIPTAVAGIVRVSIVPHGDEAMMCVIEDNGIGREESLRRRGRRGDAEPRTSLGLRLTGERLELLAAHSGKPFTLAVRDISLPDGRCGGTRVEIVLPTTLRHSDVQ